MAGLQKEIWVAGIQENPIPNGSFVLASRDLSQYVDNNKLHLAEAGVEPSVHENYFSGSENDLPLATITDIPNEVTLNTYSTERTRHRNLQEVELQYNKRQSVIDRHKVSLSKNIGVRAAYQWSPSATNDFNKITNLASNASIIDAIIDMQAFFNKLDIYDGLNMCLTADHLARIKKEDKTLYKEIMNTNEMYGFKIYRYNRNPLYTSEGVKKPFGSALESGDKMASFVWVTNEVFRCFGDTEVFETLRSAATQADEISFAQRALVGKIRTTNPKYLGAIL